MHAQQRYTVSVQPDAGTWESKAAEDLSHYMGQLISEKVTLNGEAELEFVVGQLALSQRPELADALRKVALEDPVLRADAIVVQREGSKIYLVGSNDSSHYFAVSWFLHKQGCRWYTPGPFGECIPKRKSLDLDGLDVSYAPPFELRHIWVAWEGEQTGFDEFAHRNFLNQDRSILGKHALGELLPPPVGGKKLVFNDPKTVQALVSKLTSEHSESKNISVSMADLVMSLESEKDLKLAGGFRDKFFDSLAVTDALLPFYNQVCEQLWRVNPQSESLLTFLAYTNLTLPPQRAIKAAKPLIAFLAPIDIDPNHALTNVSSPERTDYFETLKAWNRVMDGRVVIYDYDQSMLVWRDLPNPSHFVVQEDVKTCSDLGILGFATESRNATATTFTNLFFRAQLYWNPDLDVERELALFFKNFYGTAAAPMATYWNTIFEAWANTKELYHEFYIIPSIYTPGLVDSLRQPLAQALKHSSPGVYGERLRFTELSFQIIDAYTQMLQHVGRCDFGKAVEQGEKGLAARAKLKAMNSLFTTGIPRYESGSAWWPGEVEHYRNLSRLSDGELGSLLRPTPLRWSFRPDPHDHGIWRNWAGAPWSKELRMVATDKLLASQDMFDDEGYLPEGFGWFRCSVNLSGRDIKKGKIHLNFPGLFNSSWLYVNGYLVDWRSQYSLVWRNDYDYDWDIDISEAVQPGENIITLRTVLNQHPSGMFRRPFLYTEKE